MQTFLMINHASFKQMYKAHSYEDSNHHA